VGVDLEAARPALARFLATAAGADRAEILTVEKLSGGAIQNNYGLDLELEGGPMAGRHALVLRTDAPSVIAESHGRAEEFALLKVAYGGGVRVPEPLWLCTDLAVLGQDFYLMRRIGGAAAGHIVTKAVAEQGDGSDLAAALAQEMAKIHRIVPECPGVESLAFLGASTADPAGAAIARLRGHLDRHPLSHPALEWGFRWAELNKPSDFKISLIHNDFRTGNYMVNEGKLMAVLDWEFASWGDPMADLGWFCAKCWRFGAPGDAGGIADRETFYAAYERASGQAVNNDRVFYWEVMAHLRWAVTAILQGERHVTGGEISLDLALTGRRPAELELEILHMIQNVDGRKG
jgi:aminoglycoside phosphotransferase (APT) family kinase protein